MPRSAGASRIVQRPRLGILRVVEARAAHDNDESNDSGDHRQTLHQLFSVRVPSTVDRRRYEPTFGEQRLDTRLTSTEREIERSRVFSAAARENHPAESLAILARHSTTLGEPRMSVVIEHLRPQVGEIARLIPTVPDVRE